MKVIYLFIILLSVSSLRAAIPLAMKKGARDSVFTVRNPDFKTSPHTGMTREHWKDAARYLLEGAFSHVKNLDDPMLFPKQAGKSYPRDGKTNATEKMEGLCRTLFLAVPLLKEDPGLVIQGIPVASYYRHHLALLCDSSSSEYIDPRPSNGGPSQKLVEFGGLCLSLTILPEQLWHPLDARVKAQLSKTMMSYADGPTVPSNWRFFNVFVLSFLKSVGYTVNEELLEKYLRLSLKQYRGEGWYNDNPAYDYYSMWAFQMYGMLWTNYYGSYYPQIASEFRENFKPVKDNYPYMFSRDGSMIMWGRSITYRTGAMIPFPLTALENDARTNYGWLRRISSAVILQFLQHPALLQDGVPTLGFYGAFEPAVQAYSCRGSVYWMGKGFLGLLIPKESPFWTATENEGPWQSSFSSKQVYNKFQPGSQQLITDYPDIGAAEIRSWCHVKLSGNWEPFRASENYNRLSYNSAFPWQADGSKGEVSMNYLFKSADSSWEAARLFSFQKYDDGVYSRRLVRESDTLCSLDLHDIPLPGGILRVDKYLGKMPVTLRLGHYALPEINGTVRQRVVRHAGKDIHIIDNGKYQLAMVPLRGWQKIETLHVKGLHPEAANSAVINVQCTLGEAQGRPLLATLMLWKKSNERFADADFDQVLGIEESDQGIIRVRFKDMKTKTIR